MAFYEDKMQDLPRWLGISWLGNFEGDIDDISPNDDSWTEKRISPIWDHFVKLYERRGVSELLSAKAAMLQWADKFETEEKRLEKYDPVMLEREGEEADGMLTRDWERALFTFREVSFRISVLENVMWRQLMYGDTRKWGDLSPEEREDALVNESNRSRHQVNRKWIIKQYNELRPKCDTDAEARRMLCRDYEYEFALAINESTIRRYLDQK